MKLISFTVPCYNSEGYMRKCIDSLLEAGEEAEIIIIDDGSKDSTGAIADEYAEKFPSIVKVVHQENGGHGEGINQGIKHSTGLYFKVVDSDDRLDKDALLKLMQTIRENLDNSPDLYINNFVYDHALDNTSYVSDYKRYLKPGVLTDWEKMKGFHLWHMMLMHAFVYKREVLIKSGIVLPKHTFYEDNYFAYMPLPHVKSVYYLDVNLYYYFIGRSDQSVTTANMFKRYEQQIRVMELMSDAYTYDEIKAMPKGLKKYMFHCLNTIIENTVFFTCGEYSPERKDNLKKYFNRVKAKDKKMYYFLRYRSYAALPMAMPWKIRGKVMLFFYNILCKYVKLG